MSLRNKKERIFLPMRRFLVINQKTIQKRNLSRLINIFCQNKLKKIEKSHLEEEPNSRKGSEFQETGKKSIKVSNITI